MGQGWLWGLEFAAEHEGWLRGTLLVRVVCGVQDVGCLDGHGAEAARRSLATKPNKLRRILMQFGSALGSPSPWTQGTPPDVRPALSVRHHAALLLAQPHPIVNT